MVASIAWPISLNHHTINDINFHNKKNASIVLGLIYNRVNDQKYCACIIECFRLCNASGLYKEKQMALRY